jgi:release factor H-coupled RctB family protein
MEEGALRQLNSIDKYPRMELVVGLPDLHGGRSPVGLTAVARDQVYPYLIGNDIGCGVGLWATSLPVRKFKLDRCEKTLNSLEALPPLLESEDQTDSPIFDLGSIGGGNHFLEFQKVEEIRDPESFSELGLSAAEMVILVHTGSRGFGQSILNSFNRETGYKAEEEEALNYLKAHDLAIHWAALNRKAAVHRLIMALGLKADPRLVLDAPHNYIEKEGHLYYHRKGAVSTRIGPVAIPGSRGAFTYLVRPNPDSESFAYSLSHGAGRKWARSMCRDRLSKKGERLDLHRTSLNSRVICHDRDLLCEEAPEAYKNIEEVIKSLLDNGLITVIAALRPVLTFKN